MARSGRDDGWGCNHVLLALFLSLLAILLLPDPALAWGPATHVYLGQGVLESLHLLPQAVRAVIPPMTSVLIALAKNTSVAAAFGLAEATATMRGFTNDNADQRIGIFLTFAVGYIIVVEVISLVSYGIERKVKVAR